MSLFDFVKKNDPENQYQVLIDSYQQVEYAWENEFDVSELNGKKFNSVIVSGLGGSAISGDILPNFLQKELNLPYFVNRNYYLPPFADENTLLIISSYSGNTEETLSVLNEGIAKNCKIICIGSGGKVNEIALERNYPFVKLQKGFQPRFALYSNFFSLLKVFQKLDLINKQDDSVTKIIKLLKTKGKEYSEENNFTHSTAHNIIGFIPVVYSGAEIMSAAGSRLKCQFNENSKLHSFHNVIPELNHNEIIGWETFLDKQFNAKLINVIDQEYHPQVKRRFEITSELVSNAGAEVINLSSNEASLKERIFDLIYMGDWISYYLAVLRGINPTSIKNINYLKEKLVEQVH